MSSTSRSPRSRSPICFSCSFIIVVQFRNFAAKLHIFPQTRHVFPSFFCFFIYFWPKCVNLPKSLRRYTLFLYLCTHDCGTAARAALAAYRHNDTKTAMKQKTLFIVTLVAVLLEASSFSMLLTSCSEEKRGGHEAAHYQTMVVSRKDMTLERQYSARISGRQIVEVRPQVSGCITRILTGEGEGVRKGQTLFIIDQVPYRAALEVAVATRKSAEARLATARMNYENELRLQKEQVVGDVSVLSMRNALSEAEAALAQAKAQEVNARNNLSYTEVKSPVNGVASMIPWHVGSLVSSSISEPLVTVADDSEVYVYFSISENQELDLITQYGSIAGFISKSPAVELRLNNGQSYDQKGRISAVSGTVDAQTGAVTLRATFPNPSHLLHNGGSAKVVVPTHRTGCIVIPQEATYELQNRMFVYRVIDGKTKATAVTLFPQNNGREYIVEEGLSEGDTIIAEGAGLLKEGIEIKNAKSL
jgi:membrane fusion protein (multidrug efflux system)